VFLPSLWVFIVIAIPIVLLSAAFIWLSNSYRSVTTAEETGAEEV